MFSSPILAATASSSKGKASLHDTDNKTTPPRYSTILPKLPLPIIPSLPTPLLPPAAPIKDLPALPQAPKQEFIAYPTFTERKMHISSPAFILLLVLLFLESTVIFIYTTIGLVKYNPLPYLYVPIQPVYPLCQDNIQVVSGLRYGTNVPNGAIVEQQQTSITTVTATVYNTLTTPTTHAAAFTPPILPHIQPLLPTTLTQAISTITLYASHPADLEESTSTTTITLFTSSTAPTSASPPTITITTIPDTNAIVTRTIYSTTTPAVTEPESEQTAKSTVYITTILPATNVTPTLPTSPTSPTSTIDPSNQSKQAEITMLTNSSTSPSPTKTSQTSSVPSTTTADTGAVVTSVIFSTTLISASQTGSVAAGAPRSTVYVTTVVPGR